MRIRRLILLSLISLPICLFAQNKVISITDNSFIPIDTTMVDLYYPTFSIFDTNNNLVERKTINSKPCLVYFIMPGCAPCSAEMPYINKLYTDLKDEVDFIIFACMTPDNLKTLYDGEKYPLPPTICIPERKDINAYMINRSGFPLCIIMDKQNNIKLVKRGGGTTEESGKKLVELLRRHCLKILDLHT